MIEMVSQGLPYDTLSRLTAFKNGPTDVAIESYAYDVTGNRQSFTNAAGTQTYTYPSTSHRLSQVGATARSYDAAGNTTAIGGTAKEFVYDATGRMSQVKQNAIVQRSYAYNGKGEQVRKYAGTANTYTLYDEAGHWLGDYDNTGAALQQAIWLDDLPVGLIANGNQLHYVEPDHLGTPRVVIEVLRNVPVWTWDLKSEAFGNSVPNQDPDLDSNPFVFDMRFPGQRHDSATGLNYNYFRDYDSGIGRYVQSDPIGLAGGLSIYAYVNGNPTFAIDPLGLDTYQIVTYDFGVGSHSALFIDTPGKAPFLYDPAGSYRNDTRGSSGIFEGREYGADLSAYLNYQRGTGSRVEVTRLRTTPTQEEVLKDRADWIGDPRGFSCAISVSAVLSGYCNIRRTGRPGILGDMAKKATQECPNGKRPKK